MLLQNFDINGFLRDYWQKRPLLIRNPWADWTNPLSPDELAGLACEDAIETRLVILGGGGAGDRSLEHGPFAEERFSSLGAHPWTLLVQAADHHVAEVAALIEPFRFVPDWRIDDVMVSYASDGGGVGPHFDQYDVFLIQGLGRRRWQIGGLCGAETPLLPNDDLRLVADFAATEEWVLEPGDILYLPPGVAHDGVAVGDDCMTYSVGFRAPALSDLVIGFAREVAEELEDGQRYADPDLAWQDNAGEIAAEAIARLHAMVAERMGDRSAFARWFGSYSTMPKYPELDWRPEEPIAENELRSLIELGAPLIRNPASRFSFVREGATVLLFVDGETIECADGLAAMAQRLCAAPQIEPDPAWADSPPAIALLKSLIDQGCLAFEPED